MKRKILSLSKNETDVNTSKNRPKSDCIIITKDQLRMQIEASGCLKCHLPLHMKINQQKVYFCDYDVICNNCKEVVHSQEKDVFKVDDNGVVREYCEKL